MSVKGGRIEVISSPLTGISMAGTSKKQEKDNTAKGGRKKPPRKPVEADEEEDGDIATPKRDRTGDDDQPL
jgi:hypothetical protein